VRETFDLEDSDDRCERIEDRRGRSPVSTAANAALAASILTTVTRHVCLLAALPLVAILPTLAQSPSFSVAIVRPDGHLVPFAAYANGRWERAWPEADEGNLQNPTLANTPSIWRRRKQPVPKIWHVSPPLGARPSQARVTGIDAQESGCQTQIALKTDLLPLTDEGAQDRVALDTKQLVHPIEEVRQSDPTWQLAERVIAPEFSVQEAAQARKDRVQLPSESSAPPVRIKHLYREVDATRSAMYFVAEKPELNPSDAGCKARTIMTGWLIATGGGEMAISSPPIFRSDCDGVAVRVAAALAVLHVDGHVFWILEENGYEDIEYMVIEITGVVVRHSLVVNGGGC
jgi:hypothetical protein